MNASRAALRLVIAGGGTGGHVFPGIAVGEALARRVRDLDVTWVGTPRGIEAKILPQTSWRFEPIALGGLNGVRGKKLLRALSRLPPAGFRALEIVREVRPHIALGVGGYAAGPLMAMAVLCRIPCAVIEPNAVPGLTNRVLSRFVRRAFVTHEATVTAFPSGVAVVTGSPVRRAFLERMSSPLPSEGTPVLLVIGGSQGARAINEVMPRAIACLRNKGVEVSVVHQTGAAARDKVREAYRELGVDAEVVAFIDDVAAVMETASLVVCRAGAMTVAELGVLGRPALFIPLPSAADDHQRKNAEALTAQGAAEWIAQSDLTPEGLADRLSALFSSPDGLAEMGLNAWLGARPDAAGVIADSLLALSGFKTS